VIAELCERWDVTVVSDEVYARLVFDGREHLSVADVPGLRERSIVIGSLSKSHAASGWRLGFLRADAERTAVLRRVHEVTTNGTAAPLQLAAGRADVFGAGWAPAAELAQRRDRARALFERLGLRFGPTDGGPFLFGDIRGVTDEPCDEYVRTLLTGSGVLIVPGSPFFADAQRGRHFVRIATNRPPEVLRAAERALLGEGAT
jgi:aminotransferase